MATDFSTLDNLPMQVGGDTVRLQVFRDFRTAIDGKLVLSCTSATRPTGTQRFTGRRIYETDTKMERIWDGTRWMWAGGAAEMLTLTLPTVAYSAGAYVTFPVTAGGAVAAQTNDPDSAFSIVTTAGAQGIQVRDPGIYVASADVAATISSPDAVLALFVGGVTRTVPFAKSGDALVGEIPFILAANDTVVPKVYTYTGAPSYSGRLTVRKVSGK